MKVLIACEFSGVVRTAFEVIGHDAVSCDLLPSELPGKHYQGNVMDIINNGWDMMIAHPPCTDLAVSGSRYFSKKIKSGVQQKSIDFFLSLVNAPIARIAIENPVCIMSSLYRKPDQIIQPFDFGHFESKKTCLWLKNLPPLISTKPCVLPGCGHWDNQTLNRQNKLLIDGKWIAFNDPRTAYARSKTYQGIADIMANQWGFEKGVII